MILKFLFNNFLTVNSQQSTLILKFICNYVYLIKSYYAQTKAFLIFYTKNFYLTEITASTSFYSNIYFKIGDNYVRKRINTKL